MPVVYDKLWLLLKDRNMKKKELAVVSGISHASIAKLAKNENVNTDVLSKICKGLDVGIEDIMEYSNLKNNTEVTENIKTELKPFLKWAGGKTQLLNEIKPLIPQYKGKYIEAFIGGGALFFSLNTPGSIIADSNPELVNTYKEVANHPEELIALLKQFKNEETEFYKIRSLDWNDLSSTEAAARFIYLNKTCFNGLYRVNKKGEFNVPFGKYKNPKICDEELIRNASKILKRTKIVLGDYKTVLRKYAKKDDFVFLDPPYVPISEYSDFKRYTKEQFDEDDQRELAQLFCELSEMGCKVMLTNSNAPLVHELYKNYKMIVVDTKRHINSKGDSRKGEDVIILSYPTDVDHAGFNEQQVNLYPPTRYMGSKNKLIENIWNVTSRFKYETVLDLFSGSSVVGYMFKSNNKTVYSNDYMSMCACFSKTFIENNNVILTESEALDLLKPVENDHFVERTFKELYFSDEDNQLIDNIRTNIKSIQNEYKRSIAMTSLIRACMKKRARGIFTYTGHRYDDGRLDLKKSLTTQFLENVDAINKAIYDNGKNNKSYNENSLELQLNDIDLVYIDPPYYSTQSDNEYVRRYHFVEGLARDWQGVEIQQETKTKKFKSYPTPFSRKESTETAFKELFEHYKNSIIVVSYSSNSLPNRFDMVSLLKDVKHHVEIIPIDYTYSFGNQKSAKANKNKVQEYIFVAY